MLKITILLFCITLIVTCSEAKRYPDDRLGQVEDYLKSHLDGARPKDDIPRVMFYLFKEVQNNEYEYRFVLNQLFISFNYGKSQNNVDEFIDQVLRDTKKAENDNEFAEIMIDLYQYRLSAKAIEPGTPEWDKHYEKTKPDRTKDYVQLTLFMAQALHDLPQESLTQIMKTPDQTDALVPVATGVSKAGGVRAISTVKLRALQVPLEAVRNIHQWWTGKISGVRCVKNIMQEVTAGVAGMFCSYGVGIAGDYFCYTLASNIMDRVLLEFFDLPRDVALENAYNTLGVRHSATSAVVNRAYRELAQKHHPDKGGDQEMFIKLNLSMELIKEHRNDL